MAPPKPSPLVVVAGLVGAVLLAATTVATYRALERPTPPRPRAPANPTPQALDEAEARKVRASPSRSLQVRPERSATPSPPTTGATTGAPPPPDASPPDSLPARASKPLAPGFDGTAYVLLLGLDNRSPKVTGRTDTMIVLALRAEDRRVGAFSIPRDLWTEIPDLGPARISSVLRIGEVKLGPGEGLPLLRAQLQREFGIRIDHYAAVDLAGFVEVVDALGGLDVDISCPIVDCFWTPASDESCRRLELEAGRQHLDGETALYFARSRHGRGDRDRRRRQQAVLLGAARRVRQQGLAALPRLWRAVRPHLQTNLGLADISEYARLVLDVGAAEIGGFSIRHPMVRRHVTEEGKHVLLLDRERFDLALDGLFDASLPGAKGRRRCPAPDVALHP